MIVPVRIGLIGAGSFARRHLEALLGMDCIEVVGHHAATSASAERHARRYGGHAYDTVRALLDEARPDAVWITVPPAAHGSPEMECVARQIPFFVEKPLSADRDTGERIGAAVASAGLITAVGYHWRALDTIAEVRERLAGATVRLIRGSWHDATPPPAWWRRRTTSGGQMVEQATHVLDLARHLVGDAEVVASAVLDAERAGFPDTDVAVASAASLRYRSGALGVFSATCALGGPAEVEVAFYADGLRVVVDQQRVRFDDGRSVRSVRRRNDPVVDEDRAFLEAVRASDPSRCFCSYGDALGTHRLAHAIEETARRG